MEILYKLLTHLKKFNRFQGSTQSLNSIAFSKLEKQRAMQSNTTLGTYQIAEVGFHTEREKAEGRASAAHRHDRTLAADSKRA